MLRELAWLLVSGALFIVVVIAMTITRLVEWMFSMERN
jgi:hypothetical protein